MTNLSKYVTFSDGNRALNPSDHQVPSKAPRPPLLSCRDAAIEFGVPHLTLALQITKDPNRPAFRLSMKPRGPGRPGNTFYVASELRTWWRKQK